MSNFPKFRLELAQSRPPPYAATAAAGTRSGSAAGGSSGGAPTHDGSYPGLLEWTARRIAARDWSRSILPSGSCAGGGALLTASGLYSSARGFRLRRGARSSSGGSSASSSSRSRGRETGPHGAAAARVAAGEAADGADGAGDGVLLISKYSRIAELQVAVTVFPRAA